MNPSFFHANRFIIKQLRYITKKKLHFRLFLRYARCAYATFGYYVCSEQKKSLLGIHILFRFGFHKWHTVCLFSISFKRNKERKVAPFLPYTLAFALPSSTKYVTGDSNFSELKYQESNHRDKKNKRHKCCETGQQFEIKSNIQLNEK